MKNPKIGEIVNIYDGRSTLKGKIACVWSNFCDVIPEIGSIQTYHRKQLRRPKPKPNRNPIPPNIIEIEMSRDLYNQHHLPIFSPPKIDKNSYGDYCLSMNSTCKPIYTLKYMLFETIPIEEK